MKIRNGFISNSSSSSFIVAFKKRPKDANEVRKMLFGKKKNIASKWYKDDGCPFTPELASQRVFSGMKKPLTREEVLEKISFSHLSEEVDTEDFTDIYGHTDFNMYYEAMSNLSIKIAEQFLEQHKDCDMYMFTYSDNDGSFESQMEHGNIFQRVPHLYINQH